MSESISEVSEIALLQRSALELIEDWQDVVERPDGGQRRGFRRALKAAQSGQAEGRFYELNRNSLSLEVLGEVAVGRTGAWPGLRQGTVKAQDALNIGSRRCRYRRDVDTAGEAWWRMIH
jgi:hypothetical protein